MKAPRFWRVGRVVWWRLKHDRCPTETLKDLEKRFDAMATIAQPLSVGCMIAIAVLALLAQRPVSHGKRIDPEIAAKQKVGVVCWSGEEVVITLTSSDAKTKEAYLISPAALAASPDKSKLMITASGKLRWLISRADQERLGLNLATSPEPLLSLAKWHEESIGGRRSFTLGQATGIFVMLLFALFGSFVCNTRVKRRKDYLANSPA